MLHFLRWIKCTQWIQTHIYKAICERYRPIFYAYLAAEAREQTDTSMKQGLNKSLHCKTGQKSNLAELFGSHALQPLQTLSRCEYEVWSFITISQQWSVEWSIGLSLMWNVLLIWKKLLPTVFHSHKCPEDLHLFICLLSTAAESNAKAKNT